MELDAIRDLITADMDAVNDLILDRLKSDVVLINQLGGYIINSGGKRMRPMLVLLAARAMGYEGTQHIDLAAIIEFIHTATLLHDDVVDGSDLRRGRETANAVWGNEASVLTGDFLYSRAFEMMVDVQEMRVMDVMSHATNRIAEGEVLQLLNCHEPETTFEQYMEVIDRKTATLFAAGTRVAAIIAGANKAQEQAMSTFGLNLGIAFQLIDDALDYSSSSEELGKNVGDDIAEGKPTLPILRAMQQADSSQKDVLSKAIKEGGLDQLDEVVSIIQSTDAIDYTAEMATSYAEKAIANLEELSDNPHKQALKSLTRYTVSRRN